MAAAHAAAMTWAKAMNGVARYDKLLTSFESFKAVMKVCGIGDKIADLLRRHAPWESFVATRTTFVRPLFIAAKGIEARCDNLGIQHCDCAAQERRMDEIKEMGLYFRSANFDMNSVLSMDLETRAHFRTMQECSTCMLSAFSTKASKRNTSRRQPKNSFQMLYCGKLCRSGTRSPKHGRKIKSAKVSKNRSTISLRSVFSAVLQTLSTRNESARFRIWKR